MKKLFIDNECKGSIKKVVHNALRGMLLFTLVDGDFAAIALRDDEIMNATGADDALYILTKNISVPAGMDADCYGALLTSNL